MAANTTVVEGLDTIFNTLETFENETAPTNPDDVPLDDDPNAALIPEGASKFEGAEHRAIGDAVVLKDVNGNNVDTPNYTLFSKSSINMTFGRIISLAGDFYTNRTDDGWFVTDYAPICGAYYNHPGETPEFRFNDMVTAMTTDWKSYLKPIANKLDEEKAVVDKSLSANPDGGNIARIYHVDPTIQGEEKVFRHESGEKYSIMAGQNADHFVSHP
jgi:hypothetical protein